MIKTKIPITIIRVQHDDGVGMFNTCSGDSVYYIKGLESLCERHFKSQCGNYFKFPRPEEDDLPEYSTGKWLCAFKSLEQFNKLITKEEAKILIENGYSILLLSVSNYKIGGHQVIYKKRSIKESKNINTLFL